MKPSASSTGPTDARGLSGTASSSGIEATVDALEGQPEAEPVADGPAEEVAGDDPDAAETGQQSGLPDREITALDQVEGQEQLDHHADRTDEGPGEKDPDPPRHVLHVR